MFSDFDSGASGFSSNWKFTRANESCSTQTSEIVKDGKNTQSKLSQPVGVQTENETLQTTAPAYDEGKLAAFLEAICPEVVKELDRVSRSNAFASYNLVGEAEREVQEVFTFVSNSTDGVKVSEVSWSCTGSVLAVATSHTLHSSWCSHQGLISLYNIDRENKSSICKLEAPSCIRCVSMHPYHSSIVAAGTFSGEVLVWDTAREGSEAPLVNVSGTIHNDSVTQVRWVLGVSTHVTLVSSALDGLLISWKVSPQLSSYQILERYSCSLLSAKPGITSFAFPYHNKDLFVVSLEGGALLHCSMAAAKPVASIGSVENSKDPVINTFEPQPATVTCIEFSPHHDDIFATIATDQAIRIYSLFQRCAQHVIWVGGSLVGVDWNPMQANILISWGNTSEVTLYNSTNGDALMVLAPDDSERKTLISALAFNRKSPHLLAVGDLDGIAHVWEIPTHIPTKPKSK